MFAVELYFDPATEGVLSGLLRDLEAAKLPSPLLERNERPHISLLLASKVDDAVEASLRGLAEGTGPFPVRLASVGAFPGESGVVFLAPVMRGRLLEFHHNVHELCQTHVGERDARYAPGSWVPHCTLGDGYSRKQSAQAVHVLLRAPLPIDGSLVAIGLHDSAAGTYPYRFPFAGTRSPERP